MERIILHIDVNNAFLSWTAILMLKNGSKLDIRNISAVIGGDPQKRSGIVLAKSMAAKQKGIKTAETLYSAIKKDPTLKVYPPDFNFYNEMSNKLFLLLSKYTPDIEIASIDECYLDYGPVKTLYGDQMNFAIKIAKEIYDTLGFTVNIGIANNKLCAKMASDFSKPNKIHTLYNNEIKEKMHPLPIGDLFGIGKQTSSKLIDMGITKIGDLANYDINKLTKVFKNQAYYMINIASGIDDSKVISENVIQKGIGNEITLIKDVNNRQVLHNELLLITTNVALRLRSMKKYAYTVVVILKDSNFKKRTHQKKLKNATNITSELYDAAKLVFDEMWGYEKIRLIGLRVDNLIDNITHQISLFENIEDNTNLSNLDKTVDNINEKYGVNAIKKASLINKKHEFK